MTDLNSAELWNDFKELESVLKERIEFIGYLKKVKDHPMEQEINQAYEVFELGLKHLIKLRELHNSSVKLDFNSPRDNFQACAQAHKAFQFLRDTAHLYIFKVINHNEIELQTLTDFQLNNYDKKFDFSRQIQVISDYKARLQKAIVEISNYNKYFHSNLQIG